MRSPFAKNHIQSIQSTVSLFFWTAIHFSTYLPAIFARKLPLDLLAAPLPSGTFCEDLRSADAGKLKDLKDFIQITLSKMSWSFNLPSLRLCGCGWGGGRSLFDPQTTSFTRHLLEPLATPAVLSSAVFPGERA